MLISQFYDRVYCRHAFCIHLDFFFVKKLVSIVSLLLKVEKRLASMLIYDSHLFSRVAMSKLFDSYDYLAY